MDSGVEEVDADESTNNTGENKGGSNDDHTQQALPNGGPGLLVLLGITAGTNISIAGRDKLEDEIDTGNNAGELEEIADEDD